MVSSGSFQIGDFMLLLRERIYTKNPNVRQFLISWVNSFDYCQKHSAHDSIYNFQVQTLCTIPDVNLVPHLPDILDGCFQILSDPTPKIRETYAFFVVAILSRFSTELLIEAKLCSVSS